MLRGVIVGSGGYAAFFTVIAALLPHQGVVTTYLFASLAGIAFGAVALFRAQRKGNDNVAN